MDELEVICDITNKELTQVPESVLNMHNLKMLYLDKNKITSLPDTMFEYLPNLTWLDLRDNLLVTLPKSIGQHKHLENLLLQNNNITHLPKELGQLTVLKVLQLSDNPLIYPPEDIVDGGLLDIMKFFQRELKLDSLLKMDTQSTMRSSSSSTSSVMTPHTSNRTDSGTIKLEVLPMVLENNLAQRMLAHRQNYINDRCSRDKVHKVIKSTSKISVQSHYKNMNVKDYLPMQDKGKAEQLKQAWLEKLKELIVDQERILQQERSMGALKKWRKDQSTVLKKKSPTMTVTATAPYDTNTAYNAYMNRNDASEDVNKALQAQMPKVAKADVEKMMKDIMVQLQAARETIIQESDPDQRLRNAEQELKLILAMHKKVADLQKSNVM